MPCVADSDLLTLLDGRAGQTQGLRRLVQSAGILAATHDPSIADWETLLLELRADILGPAMDARLDCTACSGRISALFAHTDLPRTVPDAPGTVAGIALAPLRLSDLCAVEALAPAEARLAALLARSAGLSPVAAAEALDGPHRAPLLAALERAASGLDLHIASTCLDCGTAIAAPFDVAVFVHAELLARAQALLDDVHTLASAYHWSEAAILDMPQGRRDAYLARISRNALAHGWGHE